MDQVYLVPVLAEGEAVENAKIEQAVRETRGMILSAKGSGRAVPIAAHFHSDCGGRTEDARIVWGIASGGTTSCPFGAHALWRQKLTLVEIESKTHARGEIGGIQAIGRTASGLRPASRRTIRRRT